MNPLSVLLVDNSRSFLDLLEHYFENSPHVRVVGRAVGGAEAIEMLAKVGAEVVLMDMTMPGLDGLETTRRIRRLPRPPRVVLMTGNDGPEYDQAARQAGADACLCKSDFFARVHGVMDQLRERRACPDEACVPEPQREPNAPLEEHLVHDLNNLLTRITGYAELTLRSLPANHASQTWLLEIAEAAQAASALLRRQHEFPPPVAAESKVAARNDEPQRGGETVLVVEDDDGLLALASRVLRAKGFVVLEAKQGRDAVRVCREHDGTIHLALIDQNLTHLKGSELATHLQATRPGLRVLLMSGSGAAPTNGGEAAEFLAKPFTPTGLVNKVRDVLDRTLVPSL